MSIGKWTKSGDLNRCRSEIEELTTDPDCLANTTYYWYSKAVGNKPYIALLYHRLAIIAHPNALEQLFKSCKSLGVSERLIPDGRNKWIIFDHKFAKNPFTLPVH